MGRQKKFTSKELIGFVAAYIEFKDNMQKVTFKDVACYCNNSIPEAVGIDYRLFSRDIQVRAYIEEYNSKVRKRVALTGGDQELFVDRLPDIEAIVDCRHSESKLRKALHVVIHDIKALNDKNQALLLRAARAEAAHKDAVMKKGTKDSLDKLMDENKALKRRVFQLRRLCNKYLKYIQKHIEEPAMFQHYVDIGVLLEGEHPLNTPEGAKQLLQDGPFDVDKEVVKYHEEMDDGLNEEEVFAEEDILPETAEEDILPETAEEGKTEVVSQRASDLINKLSNI